MGYADENFRPPIPTSSGRRKMPQIPTKRSSSRQSSYTEDSLKVFEIPSHRGASLPPTPTRCSRYAILICFNIDFVFLPNITLYLFDAVICYMIA